MVGSGFRDNCIIRCLVSSDEKPVAVWRTSKRQPSARATLRAKVPSGDAESRRSEQAMVVRFLEPFPARPFDSQTWA